MQKKERSNSIRAYPFKDNLLVQCKSIRMITYPLQLITNLVGKYKEIQENNNWDQPGVGGDAWAAALIAQDPVPHGELQGVVAAADLAELKAQKNLA